jgi:hypothetical protein
VGEDGQVKLWDYMRENEEMYSGKYKGKGMCMDVMGYSEAN